MIYVEVISSNSEVPAGYVSIVADKTVGGKAVLQDTYAQLAEGYGTCSAAYMVDLRPISLDEYLERRVLNDLTSEQKNARRRLKSKANAKKLKEGVL